MASVNFNKTQLGLQSAFGTAVAPTIHAPFVGAYADRRQRHAARFDSGTWTPQTIVADVAYETAMAFEGTAFFETLPVLLNSGFTDVAPSGAGPWLHKYWVNPAAIATPSPLTALVGTVGTNIGGAGPAVKLKDLYVKSLTLTGSLATKAVLLKAQLFGTTYDDNSGAGFAFASVGLPATMEMINAAMGTLSYGDATTSGPAEGEDLEGLTALSCALLDWKWTVTTGIEPLWCLTDGTLTWSGLKYSAPSCQFWPILRTSATTYAQIKTRANARTYQNLQLQIAGSSGRYLSINMTGLWDVVPSAHETHDGEVVIKPTFVTQTPHSMTTLPHWLTVIVSSTHNW